MGWTVRIHTVPPENVNALLEYCQTASQKDPTFKYKREDKYIIIECPDKNTAYRRGQLLHYKFNIYYEVEWQKQNQ